MALTSASRPSLWRLARVEYDPVRKRPVLLYPEGAVLLNDTGAEILQLVDGQRSVADIARALSARYDGGGQRRRGRDPQRRDRRTSSALAARELIRDD